jgi:hypothetical protein
VRENDDQYPNQSIVSATSLLGHTLDHHENPEDARDYHSQKRQHSCSKPRLLIQPRLDKLQG